MAGIDDIVKNGLGGGLAVAVGAVVLGPVLVPVLARAVKPVIKGAIKGGIVVYGWSRESLEEAREYLDDTYHEALAEMHEDGPVEAGAEGGETARRRGGRSRKAGAGEDAAQPA